VGWGLFYALSGLALTLGGPQVFGAGPVALFVWFLGLRAVIGLSLGAAQAAVWYRHRGLAPQPAGGRWLIASLGGWEAGLIVLLYWDTSVPALVWAAAGAIVGGGQALALRPYGWPALVWPLVNAVGFAMGSLIGHPIQDALLKGVAIDPSTFLITAFAGLLNHSVVMLGAGLTTGLAFAWIVSRPSHRQPEDPGTSAIP
jgi:hypothetical protein